MEKALERKVTRLREQIRKLDGALVALSGGVDSAFLMRICRDELGDKAVAVTARSEGYPGSELAMARRIAKILGVRHLVVRHQKTEQDPTEPFQGPQARAVRGGNVYSHLKSVAMRMKLGSVVDGSHRDDRREGGRSFMDAKRAGIRSPLLESDLTKAEIRLLAGELGLPNWNAPSSGEKKKKRLPRPSAVAAAKAYLAKAAPQASIGLRGGRAMLGLERRGALEILPKLGRMQKKIQALGFSEIILKIRGRPCPAKARRPKKKAAAGSRRRS